MDSKMTPRETLEKYRWVETITDGGYNPPKPEYNFRELYSALRVAVEELERAQADLARVRKWLEVKP